MLSFAQVGGNVPPDKGGADFSQKVLTGLQTCNSLLMMGADTAAGFQNLAHKMVEAQKHTQQALPSMTNSRTGEMAGVLRSWQALIELVADISRGSSQMAGAMNASVCQPLTEAVHSMQQIRSKFVANESGGSAVGGRADVVAEAPAVNGIGGDSKADRELKRLKQRQNLAQTEYQAAIKSRDTLVTRFGSSLKPTLLEKAEQRVKSAQEVQEAADAQLNEYFRTKPEARAAARGGSPMAREVSAPATVGSRAARMSPADFNQLDVAEKKRLKALRESMRSYAKLVFEHQRKVNTSLLKFIDSVDNFDPVSDMQMWLSKYSGQSLPDRPRSDPAEVKPVLSSAERSDLASTAAAGGGSPAAASRTPAEVTDSASRDQIRALQQDNIRLKKDVVDLKNRLVNDTKKLREENAALKQRSGGGAATAAAAGMAVTPAASTFAAAERPTTAPIDRRKDATQRKRLSSSKVDAQTAERIRDVPSPQNARTVESSAAVASTSTAAAGRSALGGEQGVLPGEAKIVKSEALTTSQKIDESSPRSALDSERARQPSREESKVENESATDTVSVQNVLSTPRSEEGVDSTARLGGSDTDGLPDSARSGYSFEAKAPVQQDRRHTVQRNFTADYVPDLESILAQPMIPNISALQRLIEIQKRYEDFLLSLRNLDLTSLVRTERRWDDVDYTLGANIELGAPYYPLKVPGGLPSDTASAQPEYALEWGARRLDEFQWRCIAYETLLLCHDHMSRTSSIRQLLDIPHRDIQTIDGNNYVPGQSASYNIVGKNVVSTGKKSRKRSGVTPQDIHQQQLSVAFADDNLQLVTRLVGLCRVKLGIAGKVNTTIVRLTLGGGAEEGNFGAWTSVHPLDVRFRVLRLIDSWMAAENVTPDGTPMGHDKTVKEWTLRQLHIVHCAITFRVARLQKFLPKRSTEWLHDWTDRGPWYRPMVGRMARFSDNDAKHFKGKPNRILQCAEEALAIISGLTRAVDQGRWGEEVTTAERDFTDSYRNKAGILRLFQMMTSVDLLDRAFRAQVIGEIKSFGPGLSTNLSKEMDDDARDLPHYENYIPIPTGGNNFNEESQILGMLANDDNLVIAWPHEVQFLQLVLTYIWRTCFDPSASKRLNVEARPLAQGVMVASTQMQIAQDITRRAQIVQMPLISLTSQAILFVHAVFAEMLQPAPKDFEFDDEEESDIVKKNKMKRVGIIPVEAIETLLTVLKDFGVWLKEVEDPTDEAEEPKPASQVDPMSDSLIHLRSERLLQATPVGIMDSLKIPCGTVEEVTDDLEPAELMEDDLLKLQTMDDFCVVNLVQLRPESAPFTQAYDEQRGVVGRTRGGLTLTTAGRVERVMNEFLFRRLICAKFFADMRVVLEDYRLRLEAEGLNALLECWNTAWSMMHTDPPSPPPLPPTVQVHEQNAHLSLPLLLRGPSPQHDMYRYFIVRSMRNLYERLFEEVLTTINKPLPKDMEVEGEGYQEESARVCERFGTALKEFVDELRCELEFFPAMWAKYIPDRQHAVIVVFAARRDLGEGIEMLIESAWWPDDENVASEGTAILQYVRQFERVENEVRKAVTLPVTTKPDILDPFAPAVTAALARRFNSVEKILEQCMKTETWIPLDPPTTPQSEGIVDFFMFISHVFDAISELSAPMNWVLPTFVQFLGRVSEEYTSHVCLGCSDPALINLQQRADFIFNNLHNPIARADGAHGGFVTLGKKKDKSEKRGWSQKVGAGGLMKGLGFGKKKNQQRVMLTPSVLPVEKDADSHSRDEDESPGEESGDDTRSVRSGPSVKSSKGNKKTKKPSNTAAKKPPNPKATTHVPKQIPLDELTPEQRELVARIGADMAYLLKDLQRAFENVSLTTWLVRLHNLQFFCDQLPLLGKRCIGLAKADNEQVDERHEQIQKALEESAGGEKKEERGKRHRQRQGQDYAYQSVKDREAEIQQFEGIIEDVVQQCLSRVTKRSVDVCRSLSERIVYFELGADIFEDLYRQDARGEVVLTMESITESLQRTVGRFIEECPPDFQPKIQQHLLTELVKGWALLLTEMGYAGHIFSEEDLSMLDTDIESLRDFAAQNELECLVDIEDESGDCRKVDIFDYVNDFFVLIAEKPHTLAALGGNLNTKQPRPQHAPTPAGGGGGADSDVDPFDQPAPAFNDAMIGEMTGGDVLAGIGGGDDEKKAKKKKKGWGKLW